MSKIFAVPASKTLIGACTLVGALLAANVCSSVEHVGKSISRNSERSSRVATDTNDLFGRLLRDAGKAKVGLLLTIQPSGEQAIGKVFQLTLTVTNISEISSTYTFDRYNAAVPMVLVRDQSGRQVPLTELGLGGAIADRRLAAV